MTDIDINPDVVETFPSLLLEQGDALTTAVTIASPDTGPSTAETRSALDRIATLVAGLADELDHTSTAVRSCLTAYAQTDLELSWFVRMPIEVFL